jgi:hypothetical protein
MEVKMYRYLFCLGLFLLPTASFACEGQKGNTIFEDKFVDTSGGWTEFGDYGQIKDNRLTLITVLSAQDKSSGTSYPNGTFSANEGDYCAELVLPDTKLDADNYIGGGIVFLRKDGTNKFMFEVNSQGIATLAKMNAGTWTVIFSQKTPAIDLRKGSINSVRIIIKNNTITSMINNSTVKVVRAQIPQGDLSFGVYNEIGKPIDGKPAVEFRSYKVTSGE